MVTFRGPHVLCVDGIFEMMLSEIESVFLWPFCVDVRNLYRF